MKGLDATLYLDLEKPSDRSMLSNPERFFEINNNKIICLDEIQSVPEIFPVLRSIIDDEAIHIQFLITGSASPDMLRQSSESLAGRIAYYELSPFLCEEIAQKETFEKYWLRGGFPLSFLASDDEMSMNWRKNFILTFLERDLRNFGFNIPPHTLNRLWKMIAHINGQTINYSRLSNSMGYSDTTIRKYLDVLSNTFMLRFLYPYHLNIKKRIIKSPKIYIRDTGILNTLLNINDFNEMFTHPVYGSSWETLCIENILHTFKKWDPFFYRTSNGNEIDLILTRSNTVVAIEFKTSPSPSISKGFWYALDDIGADKAYIVAPVKNAYPYKNDCWVVPLNGFLNLRL